MQTLDIFDEYRPKNDILIPDEIKNFIGETSQSTNNKKDYRGLFVVSHSGGKDSQAMSALIRKYVPDEQILVIHAHLPGVEWEGTWDHVRNNTVGLESIEVKAVKTFFDMVKSRGMWPSPSTRQCTSDLKRGPIEKAIRRHLKDNPRFNNNIINCMGMRAQESSARAKRPTLQFSNKNSRAGRTWYDWLPIHDLLIEEVFDVIKEAGQKPHWAYEKGMTRLSCCFCIMSSHSDLCTAAKLNPKLFAEYVALEKEIDFTFMMPSKGKAPKGLEELTGIAVELASANI